MIFTKKTRCFYGVRTDALPRARRARKSNPSEVLEQLRPARRKERQAHFSRSKDPVSPGPFWPQQVAALGCRWIERR